MRVFNNFIYVIFLINILISQNYNYSSEDWYFISCPKSIVAISEDNFNVYFATNNGFYRYDKILEDFQYDYNLSKDNHYHNIRHFYIDKNRGYYWIINNQGIYFKSAVSSIWREMSLVGSRIYSYYEIDDITKKVIIFMVAVLQCFQVLQFHVKLVSFYRRDSTKCSRSFTTF